MVVSKLNRLKMASVRSQVEADVQDHEVCEHVGRGVYARLRHAERLVDGGVWTPEIGYAEALRTAALLDDLVCLPACPPYETSVLHRAA